MLVLSRRVKEAVVINNEVVVTVEEVRGGRVKLGISAPEHVSIRRPDAKGSPRPAAASGGALK